MAEATEIQIGETVYFIDNNIPSFGEVSNTDTEPIDPESQTDTYYIKGKGNKKFTSIPLNQNSIYKQKSDFIDAFTELVGLL